MKNTIKTPVGIFSFNSVRKPDELFKKYNCTLLLEGDTATEFSAKMQELFEEEYQKFKDEARKNEKVPMGNPFWKPALDKDKNEIPETIAIKATSNYAPAIKDATGKADWNGGDWIPRGSTGRMMLSVYGMETKPTNKAEQPTFILVAKLVGIQVITEAQSEVSFEDATGQDAGGDVVDF